MHCNLIFERKSWLVPKHQHINLFDEKIPIKHYQLGCSASYVVSLQFLELTADTLI